MKIATTLMAALAIAIGAFAFTASATQAQDATEAAEATVFTVQHGEHSYNIDISRSERDSSVGEWACRQITNEFWSGAVLRSPNGSNMGRLDDVCQRHRANS